MGNTRNTGYLQNAIKVSDAGSISFMSGSTMLATINTTGQMSGSSPVLFAATASFVANAQTASFVANAQSASNAVSAQTASFANAFTVAGTLTAQTLVVQTITSSVDFVTGSTRFGSILGNTHLFTGSVSMTGSLAVVTTGTEFQVTNTGVNFGNVIGDSHNITGSVGISGSLSGIGATFSGEVSVPNGLFSINGNAVSGPPTGGVGIRHVNNRLLIYGGTTDITFQKNSNTGPNLTILESGAATFASSVTATSLSISSTTNSTSPGTGAIVSSGGLGVNGDIFLHQAAANGSNYGYIKTAATTVNTTTLTIGTTYGFGVNVDAVSFFNGAATFNGASTFNSSIDVTTNGSFGFQDYRTQATQKVLVLRGEGVSGNYAPSLFNIYTKPGTTSNGIASLIIKSKYGSEAESGNLFEFKGNGEATFGGNINANNIKTLSFTLQGLGTPVSTGLPINAYSGGRTYLLATSQQWSDGNSTSATITMIRCGYDGNNFSAVVLGSSNATAETWSQSGGILFVTGNTNFQLDIAVISNG
jgi:hypothetical protein